MGILANADEIFFLGIFLVAIFLVAIFLVAIFLVAIIVFSVVYVFSQSIKLIFPSSRYLDIPRKGDIIIDESQNKLSLRGAGRIRLRVGYRRPDPRT